LYPHILLGWSYLWRWDGRDMLHAWGYEKCIQNVWSENQKGNCLSRVEGVDWIHLSQDGLLQWVSLSYSLNWKNALTKIGFLCDSGYVSESPWRVLGLGMEVLFSRYGGLSGNILKSQPRIADKGWSSSLVVELRADNLLP
jgi:hypothetical protein